MGYEESKVERYLYNEVKRLGGTCLKYIQGEGKPDRIVIFRRLVWLVETKSKKGVVSDLQKEEFAKLRKKGIQVWILWTMQQVDNFIKHVLNEIAK